MKMEKNCNTCDLNFNGICSGHGDTYKYGEKISDDTKYCNAWSESLDYFSYMVDNAPRFLREQFNDCRISRYDFSSKFDDYVAGNSVPINFFDAIKFIYGISIVDIAALLNVTFGVVYRAKTKGIPQKRINQFSDALCVEPKLLMSITTSDFDKLRMTCETFFSQPNIEQRINSMPEWKQELASVISYSYLRCPIHMAKEFARVDKLYWTNDMPLNDFTESEKALIRYVTNYNQYHKSVIALEYTLDLACLPHLKVTMMTKKKK